MSLNAGGNRGCQQLFQLGQAERERNAFSPAQTHRSPNNSDPLSTTWRSCRAPWIEGIWKCHRNVSYAMSASSGPRYHSVRLPLVFLKLLGKDTTLKYPKVLHLSRGVHDRQCTGHEAWKLCWFTVRENQPLVCLRCQKISKADLTKASSLKSRPTDCV